MAPISIDGRTVRVDVDARTPLPQIAHWLKDANPPREQIQVLVQGITLVGSAIGDVSVQELEFVVTLLAYYCQDYTISPTKYMSASGRGVGIGKGSQRISP